MGRDSGDVPASGPGARSSTADSSANRAWWHTAVVYQIYPRSFADANGDGIGDLNGVRSKLAYLAALGIDALWLSPFYPSPQADFGYDVADYRDVDPVYGTLDDARSLIREAHDHNLRIIVDLVPNHTSDQHPWFQAALAAEPGSAERERFLFRDGRGPDGAEPPNNWQSSFGGPAWTRVSDGQWYLHLFAPEQTDLNWTNPEVVTEFEDILRFWLDLGVDGFRIDVAHGLAKDPDLTDLVGAADDLRRTGTHPHWDRDEVHDVYRGWRRIIDQYAGDRVFVAEAWVPNPLRFAQYLRPDELHTAFNFDFYNAGWNATAIRKVIEHTMVELATVGATPDLGARQSRRTTAADPVRRWRAGSSTGKGGDPAHAGAARRRLPLPGRGVGSRRGPGHPGGAPPRSGLPDDRRSSARSRRVSSAAPVVRHRTAVRLWAVRPAMAAPTGDVGVGHRGGRGRRSGVDALFLPARPSDPAWHGGIR